MSNNTINENKTEKETEVLNEFMKVGIIAGLGGIKQLAVGSTYVVGFGVGLLKGKKAGLKTIGTLVALGSVWNTARYLTGEFDKPEEES